MRWFALAFSIAVCVALGCVTREAPVSPGTVTVTGVLTAIQDNRPADGPAVLTLEVRPKAFETVDVPSGFGATTPEMIEAIRQMSEVLMQVRIGDRLRAVGRRNPDGTIQAEALARLR